MSYLKPSDIRYSQDSIANHFKNDTRLIGETLDEILLKKTTLGEIKKITVCRQNDKTLTKDNRRLWVFKKVEELGECEEISVNLSSGEIHPKKLTTKNDGISIEIRGSGDPGGSVWRTWNKAKMSATPTSNDENGSLKYRADMLRREGPQSTYEPSYEEVLLSLGKTQLGLSSMVAPTAVIKLAAQDVGFCQKRTIIYGENFGKRLDECLQKGLAKFSCTLNVFEINGLYYTSDCGRLWLARTLEKFGKTVDVRGTIKSKPSDCIPYSLSDSLKISTPIGGEEWKNRQNISNLATLEDKKVLVSNLLFTVPAISDVYGEDSIAKVLVESYSTRTIPRRIRVIEHSGNFYALDNEILWVAKEVDKLEGSLEVTVAVKMSMDRALFSSFTSDKIKKVYITGTFHRHTEAENFIIQYIKKVSL